MDSDSKELLCWLVGFRMVCLGMIWLGFVWVGLGCLGKVWLVGFDLGCLVGWLVGRSVGRSVGRYGLVGFGLFWLDVVGCLDVCC